MEEFTLESVEVAFCHLITPKKFSEDSVPKFEITVTMSDEKAKELEDLGIKIKTYNDKKQRTFRSRYDVKFIDQDKKKQTEELPRDALVNVVYKLGEPYGEFGNSTFLQEVHVIERAEPEAPVAKSDTSDEDDGIPF